MQTNVPSQKVTVGVLSGAITTIAIWALKSVVVVPGEVAAAITTVLSFVVSYLVPPAARDQVVDS
jgi:putative flippase GtrA